MTRTGGVGRLGVAVIGAGAMGADHVRRIDTVISGARVAAIADVNEGRATSLAGRIEGCAPFTDPVLALAAPGVDAVLIASPGPAHEAALLAALERDLPVLCEKPLTPDTAGALRVLRAEQALGHRRVQVGFMRRYDTEFGQLRALLAGGELGRPLLLHCRHRNVSAHPYVTEEMLINDSVSHEFDAARWLLGQEITAVTVLGPSPGAGAGAGARAGLGDPRLVVFEMDGGALVDVEIFVNAGFGYQVQAEAVCERGTARVGEAHGLLTNSAGRWGGAIAQDYLGRFADAYDREIRDWVDATRRGETTGPGAWDGYAVAAACEAGVEAQRTGRRVTVEMSDRPDFYA